LCGKGKRRSKCGVEKGRKGGTQPSLRTEREIRVRPHLDKREWSKIRDRKGNANETKQDREEQIQMRKKARGKGGCDYKGDKPFEKGGGTCTHQESQIFQNYVRHSEWGKRPFLSNKKKSLPRRGEREGMVPLKKTTFLALLG